MENRIKELREKESLSLTEMSKKIKIGRGTINNYENGKTNPKIKTWEKLANFFKVPVSYIQGYGESMEFITKDIIFLLSEYWFEEYSSDTLEGDKAEKLNEAIKDFCRLKAINLDDLLYPTLDGEEIYSDKNAEKVFKNKFWFLFKQDFLMKLYEKRPYSTINYDLMADEISEEINKAIAPLKKEEEMQREKERKRELGISIKDVNYTFLKKELDFERSLELGSKKEVVFTINSLIDFLEEIKEKMNND